MKAFILAAGYGKRLAPLTDHTPKPLLRVGDKTLLERHLEALATAGFADVVINVAHLAAQIADFVQDGDRWGLRIRVSAEGDAPLETGGGMRRALPLLGPDPFVVVNADILCDYPFDRLRRQQPTHCHLVLVDNPDYRSGGDFGVRQEQLTNDPELTYAGIGVYHPSLIARSDTDHFSVVPRIRDAATRGLASAEHYRGAWSDVGTPERLALANAGTR
ncbi:MAG: N-acetylmuramate alpha-1-phosphate uridylyltransferase MurU [Pseudomonadota bacterium]